MIALDVDLEDLVPYIDWGPFFQTWDLAGKFPQILDDEVVGETAREVYADGQKMLAQLIAQQWVQAIEKTGSTDPLAIARAMEGARYEGITGEVWVREDNHQLMQPLYVSSYNFV